MHFIRRRPRVVLAAVVLLLATAAAALASGGGNDRGPVDPEPVHEPHVYDSNQGVGGGVESPYYEAEERVYEDPYTSDDPYASGSGGDSVAQATALLEGRSFTTYSSGSVTDTSGDTTAYLCSGGQFTYVSNFVSTYVEGADSSSYDHPYGESRTEGTWQVTSSTLGPDGQSGSAVVSYAGNDGSSGQIQIDVGPNGATVNGQPAEVGSAGC